MTALKKDDDVPEACTGTSRVREISAERGPQIYFGQHWQGTVGN